MAARFVAPLVKARMTFEERSVDEAMRNDLSDELYPMDHAFASDANWKFASPVADESPIVVAPVLSTAKSVVVAEAVDEAIAKSVFPTKVSEAKA